MYRWVQSDKRKGLILSSLKICGEIFESFNYCSCVHLFLFQQKHIKTNRRLKTITFIETKTIH